MENPTNVFKSMSVFEQILNIYSYTVFQYASSYSYNLNATSSNRNDPTIKHNQLSFVSPSFSPLSPTLICTTLFSRHVLHPHKVDVFGVHHRNDSHRCSLKQKWTCTWCSIWFANCEIIELLSLRSRLHVFKGFGIVLGIVLDFLWDATRTYTTAIASEMRWQLWRMQIRRASYFNEYGNSFLVVFFLFTS
jgi:hypothetical protein